MVGVRLLSGGCILLGRRRMGSIIRNIIVGMGAGVGVGGLMGRVGVIVIRGRGRSGRGRRAQRGEEGLEGKKGERGRLHW